LRTIGGFFAWLAGRIGIGRRRAVAATAEGVTMEMPEDVDSARRYISKDGSVVAREGDDGGTRQAAE
jgi:hypothetical protein